MKNLDGAAENVSSEMLKLDESGERCVEAAVKAFNDMSAAVDRRRDDLIATVRRVRDEKKRVLREQLDIIETERRRVNADTDSLQASSSSRHTHTHTHSSLPDIPFRNPERFTELLVMTF